MVAVVELLYADTVAEALELPLSEEFWLLGVLDGVGAVELLLTVAMLDVPGVLGLLVPLADAVGGNEVELPYAVVEFWLVVLDPAEVAVVLFRTELWPVVLLVDAARVVLLLELPVGPVVVELLEVAETGVVAAVEFCVLLVLLTAAVLELLEAAPLEVPAGLAVEFAETPVLAA